MEIDAPTSTSNLLTENSVVVDVELVLHPLLVLTISDHHTRISTNSETVSDNIQSYPIIGLLLGTRDEIHRRIDFVTALELTWEQNSNAMSPSLNLAFTEIRLEQFKKIYPTLEPLGWYSSHTSSRSDPPQIINLLTHTHVQTQSSTVNSISSIFSTQLPYFLILNPFATQGSLQVHVYESHTLNTASLSSSLPSGQSLSLTEIEFTWASEDAERVGVQHISREAGTGSFGNDKGLDLDNSGVRNIQQTLETLKNVRSATEQLHAKLEILNGFLEKVDGNEANWTAKDYAIVRAINSVCIAKRISSSTLSEAENRDAVGALSTDSIVLSMLGATTKTLCAHKETLDAFQIAQERGFPAKARSSRR